MSRRPSGWGWTGHVIDVMAVLATLFGLATSLGFGAQQANAGLNHVFGLPNTLTVQILIIVLVTGIALVSVVRGLNGGVKVLSEINMAVAALLAAFVLFVGPTMTILTDIGLCLVTYVEKIVPLSQPFGRTDRAYVDGWTAFYWAWWISWSPFVGMFIVRVSRGRTVREFVVSVIIVPSLVCVAWMAIFGGAAIDQVLSHPETSAVKAQVIYTYNPPLALYAMLDALPLAGVTSFISIVLIIIFFVTSADSGSLVIDNIASGGKVDSPLPQRIFWCLFSGLVAIVLLVGGGLGSLQAKIVSTGLPFTFVLLPICWSIMKSLSDEPR
jgi:betaine/carnitine transporter, BCCT family